MEAKTLDPRAEYLVRRAACIFGISRDTGKCTKLINGFQAEDSSRWLTRFLEEADVPVCFFHSKSDDAITVSLNLADLPSPAQMKRKIVACVRAHPECDITKDGIESQIVLLEMAKGVMDMLNAYCHSVYLSILTNPVNQRGWSDLITKDLMDKYHVFLANLHVTVGLMRGQTLLPLPPREAVQDVGTIPASGGNAAAPGNTSNAVSKDRVHVLEGAVITWTKQIRHVLKQEPENVFRDGRNPEPNEEIEFWQNRADNLNYIQSQLQMEGVKKVLKFLEQNKSTYTVPFSRLTKEVADACEEANDNVKFLRTLAPYFDKDKGKLMNESADFDKLDRMFDSIFHVILLIWKHSKYYNTLSRLAVLIREICNTVISRAMGYVNGHTIFQKIGNADEVADCHAWLEQSQRVCAALEERYSHYRGVAEAQGTSGWKMRHDTVFARLSAFRERIADALDFTRTVHQFNKLEGTKEVLDKSNKRGCDIGGTKGRVLSQMVVKIHEEFEDAVALFRTATYDIMDVSEKAFDEDFYKFRVTMKDLDRRLGSILAASFDDLDTIHGQLKLFDIFEQALLLERPIIRAELERKHLALIVAYRKDLQEVQRNFINHRNSVDNCSEVAPIFHNLPPVAGALYWCRSLKARIREPMGKIGFYNTIVKEEPESFREVEKLYRNVKEQLGDYEAQRYQEWQQDVKAAKEKLSMRLLRRQEKTGLLKVNFDGALTRLLREVRFFKIYGLDVPAVALQIYDKHEDYRTWTGQLERIVEMYNSVLTELLPVEEPLLEERILKMDAVLSPGLTVLFWNCSKDVINDFIEKTMKVVTDVSSLVASMKGNLRKISMILSSWCKESLLERKRGAKPMSIDEFDLTHKARVGVRLMNMTENGKDIHKCLKESSEALKISKTAKTWKSYVDFVNNIIIEGFVSSIAVSLQYLCEVLDPLIIARHELLPLFDVKIELERNEIIFDPPFENEDNASQITLRSTIEGWLKDFFSMATVMARLDSNMGDYLNEIKEHFQMQCLLALVSELVDNTESKCMDYRQTFMNYSFLWVDSVDKTFERFLLEDPCDIVRGTEQDGMSFRAVMERIRVDMGAPIPPLSRFDQEITKFERMKQELSNIKTPNDIHWLRINAHPVKLSLVNFARRWEEKYTGFLKQFVEDRISSLVGFIQKVKIGLGPPSAVETPDDEQKLYETMTHIRDVKLAMDAIKELFLPIRDQVLLLKKHHVMVSDQRLQELEQAPALWGDLTRASFNEKEKILELQRGEMSKIKTKIDGFREKVQSYRAEFLGFCPFGSENAVSNDYARSYDILNEFYDKTCKIRAEADKFNDLELLFDMAMSDYRPLRDCMDDLMNLKNLWDMVVMVRETFSNWYEILWDKIDTEEMVTTVKELGAQIRMLPKGMRSWPLYSWLLAEVSNMETALPLVNDLHSETMRPRHWTDMQRVTKKNFDKGPEFCFKNLLHLELHHFADDVSEIVDQSGKEAKIEKKLKTIQTTWSKMEVEFDCSREDRGGCPLLGDLTEVLERLDADSLEMMGMTSQGRFIVFCEAVVEEWSGKLRTIDAVLDIWRKVQTNWCRLEPIFMSDDIRSQLPDDSKRFEQLDSQWREMMQEVHDRPQSAFVVEICCADGRLETLESICDSIETCEKSLNEYLDQKKKAFPRFYFVANQALLDILSNGNRPWKVADYLGDVFDGIKALDFSQDPERLKDPEKCTIACGHFAKDGETVAWRGHYDEKTDKYVPWSASKKNDVNIKLQQADGKMKLEGAVETYLLNLEQHIRLMLRDILEVARTAADNWDQGEVDKSREEWLREYCAQISLVVTQIVWTEEVTRAFEDLESGSETAMRDLKKVNDERIERLIKRVQGPLKDDARTKIITIITIDVHSRDIIEMFVNLRLSDSGDFKWGSQLRFYWNTCPPGQELVSMTPDDEKTCIIKICDWATIYLYEYVGNVGRLVITPLTDRCYITLTQALHLNLGGAPAGPAGTGKTETTKDLSRALGLPIVVFNCSDQMTHSSMAQIFMGLAQVGAWGCFDEFNRISIEVLSVVSTQYKAVLDAIRARVKTFLFMEEDIKLVRTVGAFITMNPGYAGRTELPENLKALFRSVAMIVPDLKYICENMMMSEGFVIARQLAFKFVTLYSLCKELLSKQIHYDWGLRAVKSLLRQAGTLKRKEPKSDENPVLCRALRDFNLPKITTLDMPIFLRLIRDLFPSCDPAPFNDSQFEKCCIDVVKSRGLQADQGFIMKIVGLADILKVRHCCFIIGTTGCGKSETWKSLSESLKSYGQDGYWEQVNPKAITSDELYGTMSKTKEWKDGAIAVIVRNMSKEINGYKATHVHKWMILDGDIDATWIESMNTVMDDNKILTLVSNERIPFTNTMRMLLEVQDMKHASPATVSRGGVLFINEGDIGWKPFVESWRERLESFAQSTFYLLFANYFEYNIEQMRKQFTFSCPILDMGFVQSIICFLDAQLNHNTKDEMEALRAMPADDQKLVYECFFTFALMWTVGGAVADDKIVNNRKNFSQTMKQLSKGVKFPEQGECFDYRFDIITKEWVHWDQSVIKYDPIAESMFQNIIVSTVEVERMKYITDLHMSQKRPVLFVGVAGTGKTTIVKDYLVDMKLKDENMISAAMNMNSYTTSAALQAIMMGNLDKRTGHTYGPPSNKRCIFFIDDLNMPHVDAYDTQSAIMLLTQIMSYGQVYDRVHLEEKRDIVDVLYIGCMNPKSGSFMINARLQRHFTVCTTFLPSTTQIVGIYSQILGKHLSAFSSLISKQTDTIVSATGDILTMIQNAPHFLPSATKFHYQFNLKDIANIFQGCLNTNPAMYREGPVKFLRVWLHECYRQFSDRLVDEQDHKEMQSIFEKVISKNFIGTPKEELFAQPLIMTSFVSLAQGNEKQYLAVKDASTLKKVLENKLDDYNREFATMNLVLFEDAVRHVCRISRITDNPCGNALLVGVGGSGKQVLARLASFINQQAVLTILVNQQYGMAELRENLQEFYKKAAVKPGTPQAFMLTDAQIIDERFLVYINDMLSSGYIPDLFTREEYDGIFSQIRGVAKYHGYVDDYDGLYQFFLDRVRKNLHVILCHSPVGSTFRIRGRKFPALISCMVLDVFHPWPRDALDGVAQRFLQELHSKGNIQNEDLLIQMGAHMASVHISVHAANRVFLQRERRYNYNTPKSFLEFIDFYVTKLKKEQDLIGKNIDRLERGLNIMHQVQSKVSVLREELNDKLLNVEQQKESTDKLIEELNVKTQAADAEKEVVSVEADKCTACAQKADEIETLAKNELDEALPAMEDAKKAIDCLDKAAIQELKGFTKPPPECESVCAACGFLLKHEKRKLEWKGAVKMMNNPVQFLEEVKEMNGENIPEQVLANVDLLIALPFFNFEKMKGISNAAAHLSNWVVNIVKFHKIYKKVAPLMARVEEAKEKKKIADEDYGKVAKRLRVVEEQCEALDLKLRNAITEKESVEMEASQCQEKLELAERLVTGLADENERWTSDVAALKDLGIKLIGNCLLASAFVSYASPFSGQLRVDLWQGSWSKDIVEKQIPMTPDIDPLTVLCNDADIAGWSNEGLPADRISIENASILTSCTRWPLLIDPQLQGLRWLKQRIGEELHSVQLTMSSWLEKVRYCIRNGNQLIIESIGNEIDAILEPVLSRAIIKRGRGNYFVRVGIDELEYSTDFKLYLQSKLPNPHYRPETSAQCTIINFIVTPKGLEDQILAMVVNAEKSELELEKQALVRRQNDFKMQLSKLEDELLSQLSGAEPETILSNVPLIDGLEATKRTSKEITIQVATALETEKEINNSRELYRPVAAEGSMLFFLVNQLSIIEHMYQYSLDSFLTFLTKAIDRADATDDLQERVKKLIAMIRMVIFRWVNRGLFEDHKLIFCTMLTFRLFQLGHLGEEYNQDYFQFLLWGPSAVMHENPLAEWLPNQAWAMVMKLIGLEGFENFAHNMEKDAPGRFWAWFNEVTPEDTKLPLEWKRLDVEPFKKLLVIRCLRPDRMAIALAHWIRGVLPNGRDYMDCDLSLSFYEVLSSSYDDSTNATPFFFILSPGADPVKEVEALGRKLIQLQANVNYHNVAMGQGQDTVAMQKLDLGHKEGHWVMLQNIHLMPAWCVELEKKLDTFAAENSHPNFRLFVSADPAKGIPIGVLERSIKLTNEPPQGLQANLRRSFALFSKEDFEDRDSKIKSILFGLCHFHSLMIERKKFGALGYNMTYPFSNGDLRDSASVLYNYLEGSTAVKIPWEDLRYIFGDIMYGGHIVDDWDRRMCEKYLTYFMQDELLDEKEMVPYADGKLSWKSPGPSTHEKYLEHIEHMPAESPLYFGMHPNAEIGFRTAQCDRIFDMLLTLQPTSGDGAGKEETKTSPMGLSDDLCSEILDEVRDVKYHTEDTSRSLSDDEKTPYVFVFLQECDSMNGLVYEMVRGLTELQLGLKGELTMSEQMEQLAEALYKETLPIWWVKLGFPSTRPLRLWLLNLKERCAQLDDWIADPLCVPKVVDVSKLFNPQSFLTAIKQVCCQQQHLELDKLQVFTEVTKRDMKLIDIAAREGAYVTGMYLEGARWDVNSNSLEDSKPKEMFTRMPVINCKAGTPAEREDKNVYNCPTYCVPTRRPHFVFTAQLRTKQPPAKWVLAGVALILDIGYNL